MSKLEPGLAKGFRANNVVSSLLKKGADRAQSRITDNAGISLQVFKLKGQGIEEGVG